ncbi:MAG: transglycosylase SLT domain-containing protein [Granulosicoccaceae bacterium]
MSRFQSAVCVLALCCAQVPAYAQEPLAPTPEQARFMQAREALANGQYDTFYALSVTLDQYILHPFLEYEGLQHQLRTSKPGKSFVSKLNQFEQDSGDKALTAKLTRSLQQRLLDTGQWTLFLGVSQSGYAAKMPCGRLRAQHETGQTINFDTPDLLALWIKPAPAAKVCRGLVDEVEAKNTPPIKAIWERIFAAMEEDKPDYAESMLHYLSKSDRKRVNDWLGAVESPAKFLANDSLSADTQFNRRVVSDLVMAWSRQEPVKATRRWLSVRDKYKFGKDRYYDTTRALAMRAAYRRLPEANELLNTFTAKDGDLELKEWRVRTALLAQNWPEVIRSIKRLPKDEQIEDHWAYWEARALEEAGHADHANKIYQELAELQSYHGFLSADKLGKAYTLRDEPVSADAAIVDRLRTLPALLRAREYHRVKVGWEGRREWNSVLSESGTEEFAALAKIAFEWRLHDRAIFAAGKAEQKRALSVRFPVLYRSMVAQASADNSIDPAWVFGVMRRESAYIADVQSGAGARGLMQLMPNTAKYVAKLQGDSNWKGDLTDPETNIGLGSHYLRHVLDKFDNHIVLATASYNAGPRRVSKWLPDKDMTADIWIDAIPYTETRRYVRAVLAYTAIYEWQLTGEAARLSDKLTVVLANEDT